MPEPGQKAESAPGTALPLEAFVEDARRLSPESFELTHGCAFLLLTAAGLTPPTGPSATEVRLEGLEGAGDHTASVRTLVFRVRRSENSVVHLMTVGRASNNDVVVRDVSVSRFHAFLKRGEDGAFLLQDAGSTNGTTVNGNPVPARGNGPPVSLKPGDTVRLGQVEFTFVDAPALQHFVLQAAG